jgi:hypothetical protein
MACRPTMRRYRFGLVYLAVLISCGSAPISVLADAMPRPFWTEQAMFRFADDLFFIGRASCADTPDEGRQRAFARAIQELLNYTQRPGTAGLRIETQMVFEERDTAGCPGGTVTVWRLVRLDAMQMSRWQAPREPPSRTTPARVVSQFAVLPTIGMSRDQIFERFGLPRSIVLGPAKDVIWEYKPSGLTIEFDRSFFVKAWSISIPNSDTVGRDIDFSSRRRKPEASRVSRVLSSTHSAQSGSPSHFSRSMEMSAFLSGSRRAGARAEPSPTWKAAREELRTLGKRARSDSGG